MLVVTLSRVAIIRRFVLNLLLIFPVTLILLVIVIDAVKSRSWLKPETEHPAALVPAYHPDPDFNSYWYSNKAELSRYELQQARYGELRKGEAVLVFVTEHLDPVKHIKAYNEDGKDVPVMKLNHTRKFYTGVYPYSTMSSVFTPVNLDDNPRSVRVNFSAQEWCGHVWSMLDLKDDHYKGNVHSYFPDEGDYGVTLDTLLLEDEVFNRLRIDPRSLPEGDISILPSLMHLRLQHLEYRMYHADARHASVNVNGRRQAVYEIDYVDLDRNVVIYYEPEFPWQITAWEETYRDGAGSNARTLTTKAVLTHSLMLDYWLHNAVADSIYREQLGLTEQ
jgi:hypothetical protein